MKRRYGRNLGRLHRHSKQYRVRSRGDELQFKPFMGRKEDILAIPLISVLDSILASSVTLANREFKVSIESGVIRFQPRDAEPAITIALSDVFEIARRQMLLL